MQRDLPLTFHLHIPSSLLDPCHLDNLPTPCTNRKIQAGLMSYFYYCYQQPSRNLKSPSHDLKYHQGTLLLISRVSGIHSPFLTITSPSATILGTTGDIPHQSSCPLFCSLHLPKHRSYEPPTSALKLSKPPLYDRKMSGLCSLASEAFHSWALVSDNPLFPKHPEETWTQMNGCPGQTLRPMRLHISQPISCHLVGITRMRWCLTSPSPPL